MPSAEGPPGSDATVPRTGTSPDGRGVRWPLVVAVVGVLAASNVLVNTLVPSALYVPWNLAVAAGLLVLARRSGLSAGEVGADRRHLGRSARWGAIGFLAVAVAYGLALAIPETRGVFDDTRAGDDAVVDLLYHALVQIPLGTVVLEELAFRGVLPAALGLRPGTRWRWRPVLGAAVLFGLWHVLPSLQVATSNTVVEDATGGRAWVVALGAVAATTVAGVVLSWWRHVGRGLLTPVLVHVATNSLAFAVAWSLGPGAG